MPQVRCCRSALLPRSNETPGQQLIWQCNRVLWFNLAGDSAPHGHLLTLLLPYGMRERILKIKAELMDWDKSIHWFREKGKNNLTTDCCPYLYTTTLESTVCPVQPCFSFGEWYPHSLTPFPALYICPESVNKGDKILSTFLVYFNQSYGHLQWVWGQVISPPLSSTIRNNFPDNLTSWWPAKAGIKSFARHPSLEDAVQTSVYKVTAVSATNQLKIYFSNFSFLSNRGVKSILGILEVPDEETQLRFFSDDFCILVFQTV